MGRTRRSSDPGELQVPTVEGPSVVHLSSPAARRGLLALGHGAGGGVAAPDLAAVRDEAVSRGWEVALVVQPWKVAGRRVATAPPRLDAAWLDVVRHLLADDARRALPLVLGGRSAGARVACRTASALEAAAVCCLAFPLHPPGRPDRSRADELVTGVPTLVVQGERDAFGGPEEVSAAARGEVRVVGVDGDHSLRRRPRDLGVLVADWLDELLPRR